MRCAPASGTRTRGAIWAGTGTAFWTRWSASRGTSSPTGTSTSGTFHRTSSGGSLEETLYFGPFELTAGVKQFLISVSREDQFGIDPDLGVDSDSDLLLSGGVTYETPVDGLDLFVGYAENFRAIGSTLLEVPGRSVNELEPETASNVDVGVQYAGERVALSATAYSIDFNNRIFYVGPLTPAGPNYLIPGGGAYFNAGGIETRGIELAATAAVSERTSLYTALTLNDSKYLGTGDPLIDASQGIVPGTDVAGVPPRLWVVSVDRDGPLGGGVSAKYTAARRVSLTADWYTDPYWTWTPTSASGARRQATCSDRRSSRSWRTTCSTAPICPRSPRTRPGWARPGRSR